jgi:hypothetical protein
MMYHHHLVGRSNHHRRRAPAVRIAYSTANILVLLWFTMSVPKKNVPFSLIPFASQNDDISITGTVLRTSQQLVANYQVHGRIKWPAISLTPSRKDNLWKTTCLEFFLSTPQNPKEYWEINLSPSRDWNVYHFDDYRSGMKREEKVSPIAIVVNPEQKTIQATLDLTALGIVGDAPLDMSVAAVIEVQSSSNQSFWALAHTGKEADFHRRDSFILRI